MSTHNNKRVETLTLGTNVGVAVLLSLSSARSRSGCLLFFSLLWLFGAALQSFCPRVSLGSVCSPRNLVSPSCPRIPASPSCPCVFACVLGCLAATVRVRSLSLNCWRSRSLLRFLVFSLVRWLGRVRSDLWVLCAQSRLQRLAMMITRRLCVLRRGWGCLLLRSPVVSITLGWLLGKSLGRMISDNMQICLRYHYLWWASKPSSPKKTTNLPLPFFFEMASLYLQVALHICFILVVNTTCIQLLCPIHFSTFAIIAKLALQLCIIRRMSSHTRE